MLLLPSFLDEDSEAILLYDYIKCVVNLFGR
jgi:hypothetical protein